MENQSTPQDDRTFDNVNPEERKKFAAAMSHLRMLLIFDDAADPDHKEPHLQYIHDLLKRLDDKLDVPAFDAGYNFLVGNKGMVLALVGGDHNYTPTKLELDMFGWQMVDKSTQPETAEGWLSNWAWCTQSRPEPFDLVVVKYPDSTMEVDWMEPGRFFKDHPDLAHYSCNYGNPQFWMPIMKFLETAPKWAQDECIKLTPEAKQRCLDRWAEWQKTQPEESNPDSV